MNAGEKDASELVLALLELSDRVTGIVNNHMQTWPVSPQNQQPSLLPTQGTVFTNRLQVACTSTCFVSVTLIVRCTELC